MVMARPYFMKWINVTLDGWELKEDAPKQVKKDYEEWKKEYRELHFGVRSESAED